MYFIGPVVQEDGINDDRIYGVITTGPSGCTRNISPMYGYFLGAIDVRDRMIVNWIRRIVPDVVVEGNIFFKR